MRIEPLVATKGDFNLVDYDKEKATFNWEKVNEVFSWSTTSLVNLAHEAIDRHADSEKKIVLLYIMKMHIEKKPIHLRK